MRDRDIFLDKHEVGKRGRIKKRKRIFQEYLQTGDCLFQHVSIASTISEIILFKTKQLGLTHRVREVPQELLKNGQTTRVICQGLM